MKKINRFKISALILSVMISGCASMDRINDTQGQTEKDFNRAQGHMGIITSKNPRPVVQEVGTQWINPKPVIDKVAASRSVPGCSIALTMPGEISIHQVSQRISQICRVPVTVTPDALSAIGGSSGGSGATEQMQGQIPAPDANGMVALANLGRAGGAQVPTRGGAGSNLSGVYWDGSLSGLLDSVTSRLGLSWRYDHGRVSIFYLETRNFPVQLMDSNSGFNSKVVSGTTSAAGNTGGGTGSAIAGDSNTSQTTTQELKFNLYKELNDAVKSMLTPGTGRMFLSTGVMTVTDTPQVLDAIGHFIADRNKELNRQVVLNVEVLSVEKKRGDQLGIDWNAVFTSGSVGATLASAFTDVSTGAITGGFSILDGKLAGSKGFLKALSEQANVSVVTQQASTTTNMIPIPMQVADQEDYAARVSVDSTANVGTSTSITPGTMTTGFNMTMLPYIMPDSNNIQLQFSINLSDTPTRRTFTSGESSLELLKTKLKTVSQRVNMKSGQTIVMSGFQQVNNKINKQGVGSASFFGLGGGSIGEDNNTMLVILITPVIL
ncbi:MAG: Outer rane lipoprotein BfpB [Pseudomonadota bacterium]|jgi:type IVB pilus formation R64 PilN family outer membrane protein